MNFTSMELYILGLCFVVFTALTILLTVLIVTLIRYYLRLVELGAEDDNIREEFDNRHNQSKFLNGLGTFISLVVCIALLIVFAFSVAIRICERQNCNAFELGSIHAVRSNSMAKAYEKNEYLFKNGLDGEENNFRLFDIIYTEPLPPDEELKLYDVVIYQIDEALIIHRIIKIEKPNEKHPDETYYYLRGDNNFFTDQKPVTYDQMRSIWRGEKIEHIGSFILFMQSPAGALCILLMLFGVFVAPIAIRKVEEARRARYLLLTGINVDAEEKALHAAEREAKRKRRQQQEMTTHYNRPGSPYSAPRQRQHEPHQYPTTQHQPPSYTHISVNAKSQNSRSNKK